MANPTSRIRERIGSITRWWRAIADGVLRPPATERDHVGNFLDFLEDRRVLYTPYFLEYPAHVVDSVLQIDAAATSALGVLPPESRAFGSIERVRVACRAFLGRAEISNARTARAAVPGDILFFAVVALRKTLATEAAALAGDFALDLPHELTLISCERSGCDRA